ncbi:hypothetical protein D5R81_14700 [Parashewanella spongiae]|uniref:Uncharacterized protein n=1 Tax=Parashewanella spongiae TaxID=342950 RepID=A0A3A6TGQ0_9GAMM|nr:hypothetical protein [Parashewanella spongiae]MCL1077075.1 hypothetical protein [Parashewanella spongiae]RJY10458.1 hypothetical protein D5R81_14700 [Parashewanella spongiae]
MASTNLPTAQTVQPSFYFTWNDKTQEISDWIQTEFITFCKKIGHDLLLRKYVITKPDSGTAFRLSLPENNTVPSPSNHLLSFHESLNRDHGINKKLYDKIRQKFCIVFETIMSRPDPTVPQPILLIEEIWGSICGKHPLVIFDLDETLVTNQYSESLLYFTPFPIEKAIGYQLTQAKAKMPHVDFILITNSEQSSVKTKLFCGGISPDIFQEQYPLTKDDSLDKSERFLKHAQLKDKNYDQIIIVDDNLQVIEQLLKTCQLHKFPCQSFHYLGSVPQKHEQFRRECVKDSKSSSTNLDTMDCVYKYHPHLKKERAAFDELLAKGMSELISNFFERCNINYSN